MATNKNPLSRLLGRLRPDAPQKRNWIDTWIQQYLIPSQFTYNNHTYQIGGLNQTYAGVRTQEITQTLPGYSAALRQCPPAFAAQMVRASVLSQARFIFRNPPYGASPRRTFGKPALRRLEQPWPNGTTGELLSRMEWHAGLAGNAFVYGGDPNRLRVLRPDWTAILYGSVREPDDPMHALDGEVIGYVYQNGGLGYGGEIRTLRVQDVAHWSPIPDPESPGLGMSWITPALRDVRGDIAASEHKLQFFANGATPNLVVKGIPVMDAEQYNDLVDAIEAKHKGLANAYRTLYLTAGADATVIGSDMKQMDFATTQGRGETRISVLSRVPAPLLGIAEGYSGSGLNTGFFAQARRIFADSWVYPTLQDLCAAMSPIVDVPADAELWFDIADMPLLREDAKDAAEIEQLKATTIGGLVKDGFTPESAIAAVMGQDMRLLKPIPGWVSVQLQQKTPQPAPEPSQPQEPPQQQQDQPPTQRFEFHIAPPEVRMEQPITVNLPATTVEQPDVNVTVEAPPPAEVRVESPVTVNTPEVTVQQPDVNVTVQPAAAPEVRVDAPITVNPPDVTVNQPEINIPPAIVNVIPPEEARAQEMDVVWEGNKIVGVRKRKGKK